MVLGAAAGAGCWVLAPHRYGTVRRLWGGSWLHGCMRGGGGWGATRQRVGVLRGLHESCMWCQPAADEN